MIEPTIVVIAFNRKKPLLRLLKSLSNAQYPSRNITLHISIDGSSISTEIEEAANAFEWKHGRKIVDVKQENQGLLKHVLSTGELTNQYESIIVLEDDLIVAPGFYQYAQKANTFYSDDEKVAGVSLFTYRVEENNFFVFQPIQDHSDVHFIQVASSWGQSWTKAHWSKFKSWLIANPHGKEALLPDYILKWGSNSWKKLFINYLIDTDRYFVFPNTSYSSNFEEEGTHASQTGLFQVELSKNVQNLVFSLFEESNSVYDSYFELTPSCIKAIHPALAPFDFDVDLYGEKPLNFSSSEHSLTLRSGVNPLVSFAASMQPLIQNLEYSNEGSEINLFRKSDVRLDGYKRFLKVTTEHERLKQYAALHTNLVQRTTLILPVNRENINDLPASLNGFEKNRTNQATVLIVYSQGIKAKLVALIPDNQADIVPIEGETNQIYELLRIGIEACQSEYVGWMRAGMVIKFEELEEIAAIFRSMQQVHFIRGIDEVVNQANYFGVNTANHRWTPELANCYPQEIANVSTELMFWRTATFAEIHLGQERNDAHLFIETIKRTPLYVCAKKFGDKNGIKSVETLSVKQVKTLLSDQKFQARKGIRSIMRPVFRYFFRRNVPIFRLFYRETERLPMVIRYDFNNKNYYLDNY